MLNEQKVVFHRISLTAKQIPKYISHEDMLLESDTSRGPAEPKPILHIGKAMFFDFLREKHVCQD